MLSLIATLCLAALPDVVGFTGTQIDGPVTVTVYTSTDEPTPRSEQTRLGNYRVLRGALSVPMPEHIGLCQDSCTEEQKRKPVYTFNIFNIDEVYKKSGPEIAQNSLLQAMKDAKSWAEDPGAVTVYFNYQSYQYKACRAEHSTFIGFCAHPDSKNAELIKFYEGFGFTKRDKSKPNQCQEMFLSLEQANALFVG